MSKVLTGWDTYKGICLVVKEGGQRKLKYVDNIDWYFFIKLEDIDKAKTVLKEYANLGLVERMQKGERFAKIYSKRITKGTYTVYDMREDLEAADVEVFEYDLHKWKRFVIDKNVGIEDSYRILYFDIETDDSNNGIEIGRDRILSWAATDPEGNEYFETGDEKTILQKFIKLIEKHDLIAGWNSDNFDLPYIAERCDKHKLKYNWRSIMHVDMLQRARKIFGYEAVTIGLKSFSLDEVARVMLGERKVEHTESILEMFENNPDKLKKYNIQDVRLLRKLDDKSQMLHLMIKECVWTGTPINQFRVGALLDNYILREAKKRKIIYESEPSQDTWAKRKAQGYVGAYVMPPVPGYYRDIHVFDFKSLYPSIMLGWNIGPTSLKKDVSDVGYANLMDFLNGRKIEIVDFQDWSDFLKEQKQLLDPNNEYYQTCNNCFFERGESSFIVELVENFLNERKEYKTKLKTLEHGSSEYNNTYAAERVVKELANSMYGINGDAASRYYNKTVAESITYTGQFLNRMSADSVKKFGLTTIYGDTDSVMMQGDTPDEKKINVEFTKELEEMFGGLHKNIIYMEYEKLYAHFIILSKKKYTGILSMQDGTKCWKHFAHGTEDAKKTYMSFAQGKFTELVQKIFDDVSESELSNWILELREFVMQKKIPTEELILRSSASKHPAEYKTTSPQIRFITRLIDEKKVLAPKQGKQGAVFMEYIMSTERGLLTCMLPDEATPENIDWQYYWEKQVYPPLMRVLTAVFPHRDWKWYIVDTKQTTLW